MPPRTVKLVVIGDGGMGKTCALIRYSGQNLSNDYTPTVFDTFTVDFNVSGQQVELSLWDTAGHEDYDNIWRRHPNTDVVLLCFSVASPTSYADVVTRWHPELLRFCGDGGSMGVPVILVGTKVDLRDDPNGEHVVHPGAC
eukprot:TRINITY_DN11933_c0_g1_i1.p2 TRINITY_DN11933_c0_g1~~TRINITY_DN11933_c0_g1_i1.p2  ORF type:complete len:141 (+),score=21.20 TRINITY_DN11933_c0_g1_i1:99-521(+)